ncbi:MAG: ADP-ribosylglycohydrolase family protein [Sediminibacterium sp.]
MKRNQNKRLMTSIMKILFFSLVCFQATIAISQKTQSYRLSKNEYREKVEAVWLAQIIGASMGWQFEHKQAQVLPVTDYPKSVKDEYDKNGGARLDDDWYYEMITLRAFQNYGPSVGIEQLGDQWLENRVGSWGAGEWARINLERGVKAPLSGHPQYNRMWFTMGNQARGELYGLLSPGMPNNAARISHELGHVSSYAEGTQGGIYVSTLISLGFIKKDLKANMWEALQSLPKDAPHYTCIKLCLDMATAGKTHKEICNAVQDRWHLEYPATNNTVVNMGIIIASLWYGGSDFLKTINLAFQGGDFTDADNNGAISGAVLASIYGRKILPPNLIPTIHNRIIGKFVGPVEIKPPVDISVTDLSDQTVVEGEKFLAFSGVKIQNGYYIFPLQKVAPTPSENFSPNDFTKYWNPQWTMERAGFGAPGGGHRGIRGGTFLDSNVLATFPRDETRGVVIYRKMKLGKEALLQVDVAADPGRAWKLEIFADNDRLLERLVDGGSALVWDKISETGFPPPTEEYFASSKVRQWQHIQVDLSKYEGKDVLLRLYDETLVRNKYPGNAYWKNLQVINNQNTNSK